MSVLILEFINKNNSFINNKNKRNTNSTLCVILTLSLIPASTHSNSKTIVNGKKSITTNCTGDSNTNIINNNINDATNFNTNNYKTCTQSLLRRLTSQLVPNTFLPRGLYQNDFGQIY